MYKIDLHTHSTASPDGGLRDADYAHMLHSRGLDAIAVTDHDRIDRAQKLQSELGPAIIIGEEVKTTQGELSGLFLTSRIRPGMSAELTARKIREQGGLVYVPHPFERVRSGVQEPVLTALLKAELVDIIESRNGRAGFDDRSAQAREMLVRFGVAGAASSDAHGPHGWGRTYTEIAELPSKETLLQLLRTADYTYAHPGVRGLLAPKLNRVKHLMRRPYA